jgi:hypothetical protein
MKRNKKLLVSFLALNAILSSYAAGAESVPQTRYERMYNSMTKNIEQGKPNEKNYQFIERMLKLKNKELKDLYLQGDYVVKPEYLEWQVFFTGFYDEYSEGRDNTKENAAYHSKVTGYYDDNGNYVTTSGSINGMMGKPYKPLQQPKDINLGVSIPLKGLTREPINLNLTGVSGPSFNPIYSIPNDPTKTITANVNVDSFSINIPAIIIPGVPTIPSFTVTVPSTANNDDSFNSLGNAASSDSTSYVGNYNFSDGSLSGVWSSSTMASYSYTGLTGSSNWVSGVTNTMTNADSGGTIVTTTARTALYEITGANRVTFGPNFKISMVSNVGTGYTGTLPHLIQYDPHGSRSTYYSYTNDYYGNALTSWGTYDKYGELVNEGTIEGEGNSLLLISLQMHGGNFSPTVKNDNIIRGLYVPSGYGGDGGERHVAFSFTTVRNGTATDDRRLEFYNRSTGKIEMQAQESIALSYANQDKGHLSVYNEGDIVLYGNRSVGIKTAQAIANTLTISKIVLKTPIRINGDSSVGVELAQVMDDGYDTSANPSYVANTYDAQPAEIRVTIGDEMNRYAGNLSGTNPSTLLPYDSNFVEGAVGLFVNHASLDYRLKEYELKFGDYAKNSVLAYIEMGKLTLDNVKYPVINIDKGVDNVGFVVTGTNSELNLYPDIKVGTSSTGVDGTVALMAKSGSKVNLLGANTIETYGEKSHGLVILDTGTTLSTGAVTGGSYNFKTAGDSSATLYVRNGTLNLGTASNINVSAAGNKSIGVYNDGGTVTLGAAGGTGTYEVGTNGVLLYNSGGGTLTTAGSNFSVGNGSIFSIANGAGTTTNFTSPSTLNLLSGSTGFIVDGTLGIPAYFSTYYTGLTANMDVVLTSGATLIALQNANSSLSSLSFGSIGMNFKSVTLNGGNMASLLEGTLTIDQNVDLDNSADAYNTIEKSLIGLTVNAPVTITGTLANQVGLADNFSSVTAVTYNNMINNGTVNLSGNGSVGIYTNNGNITNNNIISATGANSFGIYGENGTVTVNSGTGNITVGDQGIGIYGVSYQNPAAPGLYGGGTINISNAGTITGNGGSGTIGIYSHVNKAGGLKTDATVTLTGGTINLGSVTGAIGVYVNNGQINDLGSTITVGNNGIGIYAKDADLNLNGTNINLHGNNALGLYLEGNTNLFTGTGNIDINGQNVVLFYMDTAAGTTINNNFVVTSTAGSTYTLGNIKGGAFEYIGNSVLASNGTLVSGQNSAVYLNGSTITAPGTTNVAAVSLDGQYFGTLPAGMTSGMDGENNGTIILEDSSVGIYGKNGVRISNKGVITTGNSSAGLVTSGLNSEVQNSGTITVGTGSQGIYVKDGDYAHNTGTGNILSSGAGTVGIFADNTAIFVLNDGVINLSGDKSIGIYSTGVIPQNIINSSLVQVGISTDPSDPGIGIYSGVSGSAVLNTGTVTSGEKSIGIYSNNGLISNSGISNIGDSGIGMYSTGGVVSLNGSTLNFGSNGAVGVYGVYATVTNTTNLNIGNGNYGFILKGGSFSDSPLMNNTVGSDSVYMYSTEGTAVVNDATLTMTGSDNVGFYMAQDPVSGVGGGTIINNGTITGTAGNSNIGIYNYGGTVNNHGTINVGNSDLLFVTKEDKTTELDIQNSKYAVGIYGENAAITNHVGAFITAGYGGYGIVAKGGTASNFGTVTTTGDYSTGMYTENGIITNEKGGIINVSGDNTIGMAGKGTGSQIINHGTINITGNDAIGMYGNVGTIITNTGTINISGLNSQIFVSSDPGNSEHVVGTGTATINGGNAENVINSIGSVHALPALINAGIIKSSGILALDGVQVMIKPDPTTKRPSSDPNYDFELSGTSIIADEILTSKPIVILPGFADGTNANVYKLEGIINATSGKYDFISGSLLWEATPRATGSGSDVYMSRKAFTEFTDGLWFEDFGTALENNYLTATGDGVTIYNKTAYITNETEFRQVMASLAGNVYANINQREYDIAKAFEDSLHLMQDSTNNTKENMKISVIAGKGKNKEETDGVVGYDYTTTGVLALREVERTYRHTFGYSLGYVHTGFEFKDGNESEEWVDTIQLGLHNKYKANGWKLVNDLTGRASIHNVDRNLDWPSPLERSEMDGTYETYSITSDNILGKEFEIGKKASIMPYGAFKAMYVTRPTFNEKGMEAVEVEGNDAWSAKPRAGVELKGAVPLGANTAWKLKGTLDLAYEYELADLNEREKARLVAIEDGYHKLSKPEDEKGTFRTRAAIGVEVEDRYGLFLTGEYSTGNDKEDDYRAGVTLKAVF